MAHSVGAACQRRVPFHENSRVANAVEIPAREGSSRFLKKAAQKLLLCWGMGVVADNAHAPA
jgi:hypothetical protein